MPELPELQAHAERLDEGLGRQRPAQVHAAVVHGDEDGRSPGSETRSTTRSKESAGAGKYLLLDFGSLTFVVHLMQGGRLEARSEAGGQAVKGGVARWVFDDGARSADRGRHEERAGVWVVTAIPRRSEPLEGLGPDADTSTPERAGQAFAEHPMRLHGFLRDQGCIAGLGRRLANEICHRAKLSPFASTAKLGTDGARRSSPRSTRASTSRSPTSAAATT